MERIGQIANPKNKNNQPISKLVQAITERKILPTHFLFVQFRFAQTCNPSDQIAIRTNFFKKVKDYRHQHHFPGDDEPIYLKWQAFTKATSMIYYCVSRLEEMYVQKLTKSLLHKVYNESEERLRLLHDISYITAKNLQYLVDIQTNQMQAVGQVVPVTPVHESSSEAVDTVLEMINDEKEEKKISTEKSALKKKRKRGNEIRLKLGLQHSQKESKKKEKKKRKQKKKKKNDEEPLESKITKKTKKNKKKSKALKTLERKKSKPSGETYSEDESVLERKKSKPSGETYSEDESVLDTQDFPDLPHFDEELFAENGKEIENDEMD